MIERYLDLWDTVPGDCFDLMDWLIEHESDVWATCRYWTMDNICKIGAICWHKRNQPINYVQYTCKNFSRTVVK